MLTGASTPTWRADYWTKATEVRALTLPSDPKIIDKLSTLPRLNIVTADLRDQDSLDVKCKGVTHVVHLAARLTRGTTPVDRSCDVNSLGTLRPLEASVRAGTAERLVLASSDSAYRPGDDRHLWPLPRPPPSPSALRERNPRRLRRCCCGPQRNPMEHDGHLRMRLVKPSTPPQLTPLPTVKPQLQSQPHSMSTRSW